MNVSIPATIMIDGKKQSTTLTIKRVVFARIFRQIAKGTDLKPKKKAGIPEQKPMASTD